MILEEVEHMRLDVTQRLPVPGNVFSGLPGFYPRVREIGTDYISKYVVQTRLVIEIVKIYITYVFAIVFLAIYFCNETDSGVFFPDL